MEAQDGVARSKHARTSNGQNAYLALKGYYLGDAYISHIRSNADKIMEKTFFDGCLTEFQSERGGLSLALMDQRQTNNPKCNP